MYYVCVFIAFNIGCIYGRNIRLKGIVTSHCLDFDLLETKANIVNLCAFENSTIIRIYSSRCSSYVYSATIARGSYCPGC